MLNDPRNGLSILPWKDRCAIMGIVNVTPDSFSSDGLAANAAAADDRGLVEKALAQAADFIANGADILDIGGESTRPGSEPLPVGEEMDRVVPVVAAIAARFPETLISVDTYKAVVARGSLDAGAHIINDVWAGQADEAMLPLAAERDAPIMLMHNKARWGAASLDPKLGGSYEAPRYQDFMSDILREMKAMAQRAEKAGIVPERIILDPGIGFGKTVDQNLSLVREVPAMRALGYPVLLGPSRKSFIGKVLDVEPTDRVMGTAATIAVGVVMGADIVRVHDVRAMAQIVRMTEAIMASGKTGKSGLNEGVGGAHVGVD